MTHATVAGWRKQPHRKDNAPTDESTTEDTAIFWGGERTASKTGVPRTHRTAPGLTAIARTPFCIHEQRAKVYEARRKSEASLMAKGIFRGAARESEQVIKAALGE